jgi:hypothetical protein
VRTAHLPTSDTILLKDGIATTPYRSPQKNNLFLFFEYKNFYIQKKSLILVSESKLISTPTQKTTLPMSSPFELRLTLKQHTPIIHFQHHQDGATLRASDIAYYPTIYRKNPSFRRNTTHSIYFCI